jgi:hypothetical protein
MTAVEFAVAFAFVLPLTAGLLEIGLTLFDFHVLSERMRVVARTFDVDPPVAIDCDTLPIACTGGACGTAHTNAVQGIKDVLLKFTADNFTAENLEVVYSASQLDDASTPNMCTPTVTVRVVNLQRNYLIVGTFIPGLGNSFAFPTFSTTRVMGSVVN